MVKVTYCDVPLTVPMPYSDVYKLERSMVCEWIAEDGTERCIEIPRGFLSDGASIPRPLWSVVGSPYQPRFLTAAIVHDWFCDNNWEVQEMSEVFFEILLDNYVGETKAKLMYKAVEVYKSYF